MYCTRPTNQWKIHLNIITTENSDLILKLTESSYKIENLTSKTIELSNIVSAQLKLIQDMDSGMEDLIQLSKDD